MGGVAYTSRIRIERVRGAYRRAWLPAHQQPVEFGVHGDPVHRSLSPCIRITTEVEIAEE